MDVPKKVVAGVLTILTLVIIVVVVVVATLNAGPTPHNTWINGDYKVGGIGFAIIHVDDERTTYRQLKFLDDESYAYQPMSWVGGCCSAEENRTVVITLNGETGVAKLSEDNKTITGGPWPLSSDAMTWITPEEAAIINNRKKQPVSAPSVPYPLQPGKMGKLVFLSGPPGSGKSTIAGIIANNEKWVFYEGDGFLLGFNPYVFPNETQVDARSEKPALIGPGMAERGEALVEFFINSYNLNNNITKDRSATNRFYTLMAQDMLKERKRVGGDWIIAFAASKRADRDIFRKILGKDLLFVVLDISLDLVKERLAGRGKGEEELAKEHWTYQPAMEDEPRTVGFEIIRERTKQENAQAVMDLINKETSKVAQ